MRNLCAAALAIGAAVATLWATFLHNVTVMELWLAVIAFPGLVPECSPLQMRDRGRYILRNVLSNEQCAAVKRMQAIHPGRPSQAKDWGQNLFDHFKSHFVADWRNTAGGDEARKIVAEVLALQQQLLDDPANAVLQAHDITERRAIAFSRPRATLERWSWLWGDSSFLEELEAGSQRPHGDNCSTHLKPTDRVMSTIPFCSERKLHYGFCCGARMYTAGVYLDEPGTVEGGNFLFWDHDAMDLWQLRTGFCHVKPVCGTMVMFPADKNNLHAVSPVTRGRRAAIMTWFTNDTNTALQDKLMTPFSEWERFETATSTQSHAMEAEDVEFPMDLPSTGPEYDGPPPPGFSTLWHKQHGYVAPGWQVDPNGQLVPTDERD